MAKWCTIFFLGLINQLFGAFVAMCFWNWFVVKAFNVLPISYLLMLGVVWFIGIVCHKDANKTEQKILYAVLEACVRDDKQEELKDQLEYIKEHPMTEGFPIFIGKFSELAITLVLGFGLHIFIG